MSQIEEMSKNSDSRIVGIVSFNDIVSVIGDGKQKPALISSPEHLEDMKYL